MLFIFSNLRKGLGFQFFYQDFSGIRQIIKVVHHNLALQNESARMSSVDTMQLNRIFQTFLTFCAEDYDFPFSLTKKNAIVLLNVYTGNSR